MKKLVSMMLALTMMLVVCVPAFAATQDVTAPGETTVVINTTVASPENEESYVVKIPSTPQSIAWESTAALTLDYQVTTQLRLGASVDVTVADDKGAGTTNEYFIPASKTSTTEATEKLAYTPTGFAKASFGPLVTDVNHTVSIQIPTESWAKVVITDYTTTLTYTVAYNAPVVAP